MFNMWMLVFCRDVIKSVFKYEVVIKVGSCEQDVIV